MKKDLPLVSVALCTFNGEKYLSQQLDSLINQSYLNLEIVIVDDASTDKTLEILKRYQGNNPAIKLILNEKNIGFNQNFKKAIKLCTADYVAIADQDDIWELNKIALMMDKIGDNLLMYHDSAYIDREGKLTGKSIRSHHRFVSGKCAEKLVYYNCVAGHTCLIKKELIAITPEFDQYFYYDWWLAYTAACTGKINYLTDKLVLHRKYEESSTGQDKSNASKIRVRQLELFNKHKLTPTPLKEILAQLISEYKSVEHKHFSIKLFFILLKYSNSLLYVRKRSFFSQLKLIYNESRPK